MVKNLPANAGDAGFDAWVEKIPWRRKWQPTPVFLPGKFYEQENLAGYSPWGRKRLSQVLATKLLNNSNHFIDKKTENQRGQSACTHSQEVEGPGIRIIYIQITSSTRKNRPLHLRICSSDTAPFRLWSLEGSLPPLPHCVPAAHSLLLKALLLGPSLIHCLLTSPSL